MTHLGITPIDRDKQRKELLGRLRLVSSIFILFAVLPIIIYLLFHFGIFSPKPSFQTGLQEPVAIVNTTQGLGTAFLISPTKLLTAKHVVEQYNFGDEVNLTFEKVDPPIEASAKVIWFDRTVTFNSADPMPYFLSDFAVLEISNPTLVEDIIPLDLGASEEIQELDDVILIGYPLGDFSMTKGNINNTEFEGFDLFKLDATANPGNSGGPCILEDDETVVGILVGNKSLADQGENIAVKISTVLNVLTANNISLE